MGSVGAKVVGTLELRFDDVTEADALKFVSDILGMGYKITSLRPRDSDSYDLDVALRGNTNDLAFLAKIQEKAKRMTEQYGG